MRGLLRWAAWVLAFNAAVTVSPFALLPLLYGIPAPQWLAGVFLLSLLSYGFAARAPEDAVPENPPPPR